MKESTRAVTIEIDDALAKLAAQQLLSAANLDRFADELAAAGNNRLAIKLRAEARHLRITATT